MITLNKEQVKHLHKRLLDSTGGLDGIRDEGLLDSALSASFQTFGGAELYPSVAAKIARIASYLLSIDIIPTCEDVPAAVYQYFNVDIS